MKKNFEMPTIEKVNFSISDKNMCNGESITSGVSTDFGIITDMTIGSTDSMTD